MHTNCILDEVASNAVYRLRLGYDEVPTQEKGRRERVRWVCGSDWGERVVHEGG